MPTRGSFTATTNANVGRVDQRLVDIMRRAAAGSPYDVELFSGRRSGGTGSRHDVGNAVDVVLIDRATGQRIPNLGAGGPAFQAYEQLAKEARRIQQQSYPELSDQFRWGGYFGSSNLNEGGFDLMHFDIRPGGAMSMGSWDHGLNQVGLMAQARLGAGQTYSSAGREPGQMPRTALAYATEGDRAPIPPPRPAPQLPPLMDEVTGNPLGNPSFPMSPPTLQPPAGDGSRVQTANLGAMPSWGAFDYIMKDPATRTDAERIAETRYRGGKLVEGAQSTLAKIATMPPLQPTAGQKFGFPYGPVDSTMPDAAFGMPGAPAIRLADVGSHLAPTPPARPDNLGTGGPDMAMPAPVPPPRPGSLGTRSNPLGQGVTPPTRMASADPLVGLLNSRFPVPANPGTGGTQAALVPPPPAAPLPSSFGPGLSFPSGLGMAPVTQQPVPMPIPRPATVPSAQPTSSQRQRQPALSPTQVRQASSGAQVGAMNGSAITKVGPGKYVDASGRRVYLRN